MSSLAQTRALLIQAGLRESRQVSYYVASRIILPFLGLLGVITFVGVNIPLLVCVPALGFSVPRLFLMRKIKDRQRRIRRALSDALNLTAICVEAGLGLDTSMLRVSEGLLQAHPDLSDEIYLVHCDMRAGYSWDEALCNLSQRTGNADIRELVGALTQIGPLGVVRVLRSYSHFLLRQRLAEELAARTLLMVPALVVFILVPFAFVTIGPALIRAYHPLVAKAQSDSSYVAWHKEADNPVAAQFLQPFVPLDINTYVLEPIGLSRVVYPLLLRQQKIQGVVVALIVVSETGDVETFRIVKGDTVLGDFAEKAAKQWKFKPVSRDGKAVPVISKVTFNFVLPSDNQDPADVMPEIAPAIDFPQRVRVSEFVSAGLLQSKQSPVYPPKAIAAHIQGRVILLEVISKEGKVIAVHHQGPAFPELAQAAIDAAKQWLYRPYLFYGRPVEVETQLQMNFTLQEKR
jgi:tight adherence protein C